MTNSYRLAIVTVKAFRILEDTQVADLPGWLRSEAEMPVGSRFRQREAEDGDGKFGRYEIRHDTEWTVVPTGYWVIRSSTGELMPPIHDAQFRAMYEEIR